MKIGALLLLAALGPSARAASPVPPAAPAVPAAPAAISLKPTLVVLGTADLPAVKKQAGILRAGKTKLDEHHVEILGEQRPGGVLHKRFGHGQGFLLVLVGSNGEEKLRSLQPLPIDRLAKALEAGEKKNAAPEAGAPSGKTNDAP